MEIDPYLAAASGIARWVEPRQPTRGYHVTTHQDGGSAEKGGGEEV